VFAAVAGDVHRTYTPEEHDNGENVYAVVA
jgi:hypothetical protein